MSGDEYTLGLISKVNDQALALSDHPVLWGEDSVESLYKALQACNLAVRLDINNALPVHRLPHEVLSYIFELACSPPSAATMAFKAALTHVCRYWRSVLLSYPKIWTNIFARRDISDFFYECLLRSRGLPIHLNFHYHVEWDGPAGCSCEHPSSPTSCRVRCPHIRARKTAELFGEYGPRKRLRSLDLLLFSPDPVAAGFGGLEHIAFFNRPLPELESLRLACLDSAQSPEEFVIRGDIFSRSLPKLKCLSLVHCWGGLTSWVAGLTSFHLEFRQLWDIQSTKFVAFLENNCRTLEALSLDNIGFSDPGGGRVTLSSLKELQLKRVTDPSYLFLHLTLPMFEALTTLRVRFSDGAATFSATNPSGAVLQVVESQEDVFSCCTNGLALYRWTEISTLDLDLHGSREVSESDVEDFYHSIPSLETMEVRTASHLREVFRPLLITKYPLHPSLKLLRLPVHREVQDDVFAILTTTTYARKAMGCVLWDIECICDGGCEEFSSQWAIYCENSGFGNPEIVRFTRDPIFLDRQRKVLEGLPAGTISVSEMNISKDPSMEPHERVLVNRESLPFRAKELIELSKSYDSREILSRIGTHVENMKIGIGRIRNEIAPIHKLPRDLLEVVFHHACWSDQHTTPRSAVALSHVCYQWRAILLSVPRFWSSVTVDGRDPSFAAACLVRSGDLLLDVVVQFNYVTPPEFLNADFNSGDLESEDVRRALDECREGLTILEAERDRVRRLCINYILLGVDWFQDEILEHDFFRYSLKNLQELRWNYADGGGVWSLPLQTFGGSLESLRSLRLENVEPSMGWFPGLTSLECVRAPDIGFIEFLNGRVAEFFSQNASLQSLSIYEFRICEEKSTRISMDNLTSLTLSHVSRWYLLLDLLHIKNLDGGTFTTITLSDQRPWIAFSAVNSIGFSLKACISSFGDPWEDAFMRQYFSGVTVVRLEDFQMIHNTKRLLSILRILSGSRGDMGRMELHAEAKSLTTYPQVTAFAEPFLPRLRTLAIYLPDSAKSSGWVGVMIEDLFNPKHHARFPDECTVEVHYSDPGVFLSANMGELRAEFEDKGSYGCLVPRS